MISQAWSLLLLSAVCAVRAADIHEAVRSNDMSAIKAALSSGEDINKIGNFCVPFVHQRTILSRHPHVHARARTALPETNQLHQSQSVAELRSQRTHSIAGPGGQTPLMHGVLQGMTQSVKYLLKRGADTSIPEKDGYTPMHGAG